MGKDEERAELKKKKKKSDEIGFSCFQIRGEREREKRAREQVKGQLTMLLLGFPIPRRFSREREKVPVLFSSCYLHDSD